MATEAVSPTTTAPLLTLPLELIRQIGGETDSVAELYNFSKINKKLHAIIDIYEICKRDAELQQLPLRDTDLLRFREQRLMPDMPKPVLISVIESGAGIDMIKQCIDAYRATFPGALRGEWYPKVISLLESIGLYIHREYLVPRPMYTAIMANRLDIVEALVDSGVDVNGRPGDRPGEAMLSRVGSIKDAFEAAVLAGNEEIAKFIISNGLRVVPCDMMSAARVGFVEAVKMMTKAPTFANPDGYGHRLIREIIKESLGPNAQPNQQLSIEIFDTLISLIEDTMVGEEADWFMDRVRTELYYGRSSLAAHILEKHYMRMATPPFVADHLALRAVEHEQTENMVEIISIVFSGYPWEFRSTSPENIIHQAIKFKHHDVLQRILDLGHVPTYGHITSALQRNSHETIDMLVQGLRRPNDRKWALTGSLRNWFVQFKLHVENFPVSRWPYGFFMVFRLLHLGAIYRNIDKSCKEQFERYLFWNRDLFEYNEFNKAEKPTPTRLSFAKKLRHEPPQYLPFMELPALIPFIGAPASPAPTPPADNSDTSSGEANDTSGGDVNVLSRDYYDSDSTDSEIEVDEEVRWGGENFNPFRWEFDTDYASYIEQLHAAAYLILGENYWENLKKRFGRRPVPRYPSFGSH
ncbi:hypothetical protein F5Y04DRAFT_292184 [Hypomontagnella monticulosa]|nr:hypothetical protein F5Y04DRAFT_292184 [Hypomontagnella monticulosa]